MSVTALPFGMLIVVKSHADWCHEQSGGNIVMITTIRRLGSKLLELRAAS